MSLYGGIDLHANNSVVVLLNDQDQVVYQPLVSRPTLQEVEHVQAPHDFRPELG